MNPNIPLATLDAIRAKLTKEENALLAFAFGGSMILPQRLINQRDTLRNLNSAHNRTLRRIKAQSADLKKLRMENAELKGVAPGERPVVQPDPRSQTKGGVPSRKTI